jgi:hypothetical protein
MSRGVTAAPPGVLLITSIAAVFALLPIAYAAPKEPPIELGEVRDGSCATSRETQRLHEQLAQVESMLIDLRKKYTEEHPRIRVVKARLTEIKRLLDLPECGPFRPLTAGTRN